MRTDHCQLEAAVGAAAPTSRFPMTQTVAISRGLSVNHRQAADDDHGYPVATVALYGPDDTTATKLTVGIVPAENAEVTDLRRWSSEGADIRNVVDVAEEVLAFITDTGARSVVMTDRIIGCPHEEGIDYEGPTCPQCPFWAGRDRWTGERLQ
jgi:hypothetical protein